MRLWILFVCLALVAAGCDGSDASTDGDAAPTVTSEETRPEGSPTFAPAKILIDTDEGSVIIDAEKAESPEEKAFGLMHRESLDPDAGMVFLYFEDKTCCVWMKNTLIPLSAAFFDEEGFIVDIVDMEPCEAEPCELYESDAPYRGFLEVNQGAFDRLGVEEGDRITVTH